MIDVSILIEALPYIRAFREKLFVVKLGGELLQEPSHIDAISRGLTLIRMVGIRLVVVHGGGPQANALSETLGFKPEIVGGRRVTSKAALEVAKMVFAGKLNKELVSALNSHGGRGVGLSGIDGQMVLASRRPITTVMDEGAEREVDFGYVGDVESIDPSVLVHLVEKGFVPIVSSLAAASDGTILNVNADTIASEIAVSLGAEKLIVMTSVPGIFKNAEAKGEVYSLISIAEAQGLIDDGTAAKGMKPKVQSCIRAVMGGVGEAHILNGLTEHSLLMEVFTDRGIGTMITASGSRG